MVYWGGFNGLIRLFFKFFLFFENTVDILLFIFHYKNLFFNIKLNYYD